jgi:hypothetical protein
MGRRLQCQLAHTRLHGRCRCCLLLDGKKPRQAVEETALPTGSGAVLQQFLQRGLIVIYEAVTLIHRLTIFFGKFFQKLNDEVKSVSINTETLQKSINEKSGTCTKQLTFAHKKDKQKWRILKKGAFP